MKEYSLYLIAFIACIFVGYSVGGKKPSPETLSPQVVEGFNYKRPDSKSARASKATTRPKSSSSKDVSEMLSVAGGHSRASAWADHFSGLAYDQFAEEFTKLGFLPKSEQAKVYGAFFIEWGSKDPLGALEFAEGVGRMKGFADNKIFEAWAAKSPEAAADYYLENAGDFIKLPSGQYEFLINSQNGAAVIAEQWALVDLDAAAEWAGKLEGADSSQAFQVVAKEIVSEDFRSGESSIDDIENEKLRASYIYVYCRKFAKEYRYYDAEESEVKTDQLAVFEESLSDYEKQAVSSHMKRVKGLKRK